MQSSNHFPFIGSAFEGSAFEGGYTQAGRMGTAVSLSIVPFFGPPTQGGGDPLTEPLLDKDSSPDDDDKKVSCFTSLWMRFKNFVKRPSTLMVLKIIITCLHLIGALTVLVVWVIICFGESNDFRTARRLVQASYTASDYSTGLQTVLNQGVNASVIFPFMQEAGTTTTVMSRVNLITSRADVLNFMQPVSIHYTDQLVTMHPSACSASIPPTDGNTSLLAPTAMDMAAWRACRAQDIPSAVVDVASRRNSMVPFSSNNFLFLLYVTLFLTAILAMAFIPPISTDKLKDRNNLGVVFALMLLAGNTVFIAIAPSISRTVKNTHGHDQEINNALNIPSNNAAIALVLHFVVGYAIVHLSSNSSGLVVVKKKASSGNKYAAGKRMGKSVSQFAFQSKEAKATGLFDTDFIRNMESNLTWIVLKYFEYALTAGLFLICIMLLFRPHAETYVYHIAYLGMFFCNICAIPLHLVYVHACRLGDFVRVDLSEYEKTGFPDNDTGIEVYNSMKARSISNAQWHCRFSVLAYLVASCMFFTAGMYPFVDTVRETGLLDGVPLEISFISVMTVVLFFVFALIGTYFIIRLLLDLSKDAKTIADRMFWLNFNFELVNNAKWAISMIVCGGGLASIGLL